MDASELCDLESVLPRFYPILDTAALERSGCRLEDAAGALLEAGARIVQLRHKGHFSRSMFETAEAIAALCRTAGAQLIVNDRADIALLLDAQGLHIGQDDLSPAAARRLIGSGRMLGYSTHNSAQLLAAAGEPCDYVALGPIFHTGSKLNPDPVVGLAGLERLAKTVTRPLVAIGGITPATAPEVYAAGAASIAVIGDLYAGPCTAASITERARRWLCL